MPQRLDLSDVKGQRKFGKYNKLQHASNKRKNKMTKTKTLYPLDYLSLEMESEGRDRLFHLVRTNTQTRLVQWKLKNIRDQFFQFKDSPLAFRNKIPPAVRNVSPDVFIRIFNGISNLLEKEGFLLVEMHGAQYDINLSPNVKILIEKDMPYMPLTEHWWTDYCKTAYIPLGGFRVFFNNSYSRAYLQKGKEDLGFFRKNETLDYEGIDVEFDLLGYAREMITRDGSYLDGGVDYDLNSNM